MPKSLVDYATDNITVYRFCRYQCRYCWAWRIPIFRSRIARGRYDPMEEARKYLRREGRVIVVSFTADPYPPEERERGVTREVLKVLSRSRNKVLVLTKNPSLALRDADLMLKGDVWLGTTVTTLDDSAAGEWEPRAPPPSSRLEALRKAREMGVRTWLSMEPIIPSVTCPKEIVRETAGYVDWYVLGSFNYASRLGFSIPKGRLKEWYGKHVKEAIRLLESLNKGYHVKRELRRYLSL